MRSRQEIFNCLNNNTKLTAEIDNSGFVKCEQAPKLESLILIELLLDIRDQNNEIMEYLKKNK